MSANLEQIVEEIEALYRRMVEDSDASDAQVRIGEYVYANWPALKAALAATGAESYERRTTDEQRRIVFYADLPREPWMDQRAGQAVVNDLTRCESALSASQARVGELEAEIARMKEIDDEQREMAIATALEQGRRADALEKERDAALARAETAEGRAAEMQAETLRTLASAFRKALGPERTASLVSDLTGHTEFKALMDALQ